MSSGPSMFYWCYSSDDSHQGKDSSECINNINGTTPCQSLEYASCEISGSNFSWLILIVSDIIISESFSANFTAAQIALYYSQLLPSTLCLICFKTSDGFFLGCTLLENLFWRNGTEYSLLLLQCTVFVSPPPQNCAVFPK